jgi:hypothetical protein
MTKVASGRTALVVVFAALATATVALLAGVGDAVGATNPPSAEQIRSLLVGGTWARHLDDRVFFPDGRFESYERGRNYPTRGTWRLDGDRLSVTAEHETTEHRILAISATDLEMTFGTAGQHLHYRRSQAPGSEGR